MLSQPADGASVFLTPEGCGVHPSHGHGRSHALHVALHLRLLDDFMNGYAFDSRSC